MLESLYFPKSLQAMLSNHLYLFIQNYVSYYMSFINHFINPLLSIQYIVSSSIYPVLYILGSPLSNSSLDIIVEKLRLSQQQVRSLCIEC